jgi:23S rRNA pseudouridine1911/1915/1917 synthase
MTQSKPPSHALLDVGSLKVLFEDNHLIGVYKPAGILVQGNISGDITLLDITKQYIKRRYGKPGRVFLGLVHRLDRPVSGVVLFARTSKAAARVSEQFRSRGVTKIYWALVHGKINPGEGLLVSYLKKGEKRVQVVDKEAPDAREAVLSYKTMAVKGDQSRVEISLHTGRKHQIRAQLAAVGCPVVGDVRYGAPYATQDKTIRLLARSLTFKHPTRDETIHIEAPDPDWL